MLVAPWPLADGAVGTAGGVWALDGTGINAFGTGRCIDNACCTVGAADEN